MKYCQKCGKEIGDTDLWCTYCGERQAEAMPTDAQNANDFPNGGLNILAFLFPFIGLLMWGFMLTTTPKKSASIGKAALIGFLVYLLICFLLAIILAAMM